MPSRRNLLTTAGALVASAASLSAPRASAATKRADRIDFHHHVVPPVYRETLAKSGISEVGGVPLPAWTLPDMFARMDDLGVAKAMLSISAPGVYFGDIKFAVNLAQRSNDAIADLRRENSKRLGGFASLPLPDVDAALAEYERCRTSLKLDGVMLLTNYGGKYLGHADYAPVLAELNKHKAVVFLHPNLPAGVEALNSMTLPPPVLEFVFDTTRAVADMIFTGVLDRYPDIKWVTSHLGGALPFIAWRLSMIEFSPRGVYAAFRERGRSVQSYLRSLYYDTAVSASPASLKAIIEVVGADRLVFGSDVPFAPFNFVQATTSALDAYDGLDPAGHDAIAFGTGQRILGLS